MFSLELPHRGDSDEYTQYTISNVHVKKKITLNYSESAATGFCSKGLKKEFEKAVVRSHQCSSALKFYCFEKKIL